MVISMFGCFGLPVGNRLLTMHQRARLLRFLLNEHMRCSVLVVLLETTALEARAVPKAPVFKLLANASNEAASAAAANSCLLLPQELAILAFLRFDAV